MTEIEWASPRADDDPVPELGSLQIVDGGKYHLTYAGSCPRCGHPMTYTKDTRYVASRAGAAAALADVVEDASDVYYPESVTVPCSTGRKHLNAPEGKLGCGRKFKFKY